MCFAFHQEVLVAFSGILPPSHMEHHEKGLPEGRKVVKVGLLFPANQL